MEVVLSSNQAIITPESVYIIGTYDENDVPNAMNAAWGIQSDYGEITIYLGKHKTTDNLLIHKAFTVAFATVKTMVLADYFGVESGYNVNKIEKAGCHVHCSKAVHAPIIEEFPLTLECTVKAFDETTGILVGKIVSQVADDAIMVNGKVDLEKLEPIMFDMSAMVYRRIGEVVGHAFSDGKKLK